MAGYIGTKVAVPETRVESKSVQNITATTTSLTGLSYTPTQVEVFHNGVRLVDGTDYTATNGTSITLTTAAENGDQVVVLSSDSLNVADVVPATGGTFSGNVTFDGSATFNSTVTGVEGVPTGVIAMWSGSIASIPTGWALCDGTNSTPDLRDRFIVGAGSTYAVGATGGAANVTLTESEIPSHTHTISGNTSNAGSHSHSVPYGVSNGGGGGAYIQTRSSSGNNANDNGVTNTAGAHSHTISGTAAATGGGGAHENRPPYYALAYIMKT